jgi:hypothetical protein
MYHSWVENIMSVYQRAGVGQGAMSSDQIGMATAEAMAAKPFLLNMLMYPLQAAATNAAGGVLPFWSVLLQGLWMGGIIVASALWPINLTFIVLVPVPVLHILLIGGPGSIMGALIVGLPFGLMVTALLWGIGRLFVSRSKAAAPPAS